jgi:hypothetical protein
MIQLGAMPNSYKVNEQLRKSRNSGSSLNTISSGSSFDNGSQQVNSNSSSQGSKFPTVKTNSGGGSNNNNNNNSNTSYRRRTSNGMPRTVPLNNNHTPPSSEPNSARSHSTNPATSTGRRSENGQNEGGEVEEEDTGVEVEEEDTGVEDTDGPPGSKRRLKDVFPVLER